jgi:DNA-binding MarR family transcriptional regulator
MTAPIPLSQEAAALLRENGHLQRQLFRRRLKGLSVTAEEARALAYLGANGGVTQRQLADLMDILPISLTRLLDRLEAGGWAERRMSESDRRVRRLFLTPKGRAEARRIWAIHQELETRLTEGLSSETLAHLTEGLRHVHAVLLSMR